MRARDQRWAVRLSCYCVAFKCIKGKENGLADVPSRLNRDATPADLDAALAKPFTHRATDVMSPIAVIGVISRYAPLENVSITTDAYATDALSTHKSNTKSPLTNKNASLVDKESRFFIPKAARARVFEAFHTQAGHLGARKTYAALCGRVTWPGLRDDVERMVAACSTCKLSKSSMQKTPRKLMPLPVSEAPFRDIARDIVSGLSPSKIINSVLVIVDRFSKFVVLAALPRNCDTKAIADVLIDRLVARFGAPESIVSGCDPKLASALWKSLAQIATLDLRMATPNHASAEGQSERMIRTEVQIIRAHLCKFSADTWYRRLPWAGLAIDHAPHAAAGLPPRQICYTFTPRTPADLLIAGLRRLASKRAQDPQADGSSDPPLEAATMLTQGMSILEGGHASLQEYNTRMKTYVDRS